MKNKLIFIILIFFIFSCNTKTDDINYKEQNNRFTYTSIDNFKKSIVEHFDNNPNQFDKSKLEEIENKLIPQNNYESIIKNNSHEKYISKNPEQIYSFINFILSHEKSDQILFESMQSYLRYLTEDKILR